MRGKIKNRVIRYCLASIIAAILLIYNFWYCNIFKDIRTVVVGSSINSLRHQYIAKCFVSDAKIQEILSQNRVREISEDIDNIQFVIEKDKGVDVYEFEEDNFSGEIILVYDPTTIEVGYSKNLPDKGETTSDMAKRCGAVAAINAGGFMDHNWTGTGGVPMGLLIHNKEVIFNQVNNDDILQDIVAFTEEGMLVIGKHSINKLRDINVKEAVSFGPPLIVNGKPVRIDGDGGWGIAPRTAIGQRLDGTVILMVIDGRRINSIGATLKDVQKSMLKYEAINAVNLDGGHSTTMFYNGEVINRPAGLRGERCVPSVFLVMER